jgi:hypothetical protein
MSAENKPGKTALKGKKRHNIADVGFTGALDIKATPPVLLPLTAKLI